MVGIGLLFGWCDF